MIKSKQNEALEKVSQASNKLNQIWKHLKEDGGVDEHEKLSLRLAKDTIDAVELNLINFSNRSFVPVALSTTLNESQLDRINEQFWQNNQGDPRYHQHLRMFFPLETTPSSLSMARLGLALVAETNFRGLTDIPIRIENELRPGANPVSIAAEIINTLKPRGHTKEWPKRLQKILNEYPTVFLEENRAFALLVAAVVDFREAK